jgi:hypothetical protein
MTMLFRVENSSKFGLTGDICICYKIIPSHASIINSQPSDPSKADLSLLDRSKLAQLFVVINQIDTSY